MTWDMARARARWYSRKPYKPVEPVGPTRALLGTDEDGDERWLVNGEVCSGAQMRSLFSNPGGYIDESCMDCGMGRCCCKSECQWCDEYVDHLTHDEQRCRDEYEAGERRRAHREAQQALHPDASMAADRLIQGVINTYVYREEPLPVDEALPPAMVVKILDRWAEGRVPSVSGMDELERTRVLQWNAARKLCWAPGSEAQFVAGLNEYVRLSRDGLTEEQIKRLITQPRRGQQYEFPVRQNIEHGQTVQQPPGAPTPGGSGYFTYAGAFAPEPSQPTLAAFRAQITRSRE